MRLFLTLAFLLFFSCNPVGGSEYRPSEKQKITNELIKKASTEIQKNTGLIPIGSGGELMHEVKMLALSFEYRKNVDIEEGRRLLTEASAGFLSWINQNEDIRKYLANYPFENKNIEIRIFIRNSDRTAPAPGNLVVISSINGTFSYKIDDPEGPLFKIIHKETYEEALGKLCLSSSRECK